MLRLITVLLVLLVASLAAAQQAPYPKPKYLGDPATRGLGIQRTMTLLAGSTPEHPNTVRILFYGQSITEQDWWKNVVDDLKRRFPSANLIIENRALGGFASQLLVKTAETDLYPFYPDLMIFHVYGAHNTYEDIIRRTRERTTAEVLIQTDHVTQDTDLTEETDPAKLRPDGKIWNSFMNYLWLPTVARKYGCALLDQRDIWKRYLRDNNLHASQLLKDGVHQNDFGNYLMAEIVKAYLVKRKDSHIDPMNCDMVRTYTVSKDVRWRDDKLTLPFVGNRVDLIHGGSRTLRRTEIRIDGKRLSEIPELYGFTRALSTPGGKWPVILKMSWEKPPQIEDWTMEVTKDPANDKLFSFTVTGSKTGPDGSGRSDRRFVSNSGRIVIDPADWNVEYSLALPGIKPVPGKFTVHWKVVPYFEDLLSTHNLFEPLWSGQLPTVVAQGLVNGKHILEITGENHSTITAIRIYKPPVVSTEAAVPAATASAPIRILPLGDSITQGGRQGRPEYSYRYPLYYRLKDAGYNASFVGSLTTGLNPEFVWPARSGVPFDPHHEGHYGWKTAAVRDHLREWIQTYTAAPDIALIHLGTNDQNEPDYEKAVAQPLKEIIAMLREKNPHIIVLVAHLDFNGGAALKIRPVVEQMAQEISTPDSPVKTVAMYEGWHENPADPDTDTFDWAHPNEQGQKKMAEKWFGAMQPYLERMKARRVQQTTTSK
jgi:lysophospholipase L1-like esterase